MFVPCHTRTIMSCISEMHSQAYNVRILYVLSLYVYVHFNKLTMMFCWSCVKYHTCTAHPSHQSLCWCHHLCNTCSTTRGRGSGNNVITEKWQGCYGSYEHGWFMYLDFPTLQISTLSAGCSYTELRWNWFTCFPQAVQLTFFCRVSSVIKTKKISDRHWMIN